MKNYISLLIFFLVFINHLFSQTIIGGVVNNYTPVLSFDVCDNSVTVGDANAFSVGDRVMIIQMKGASVDQTNSSLFGSIQNINSAGLYEFANIAAINGNIISMVNILINNYNINGKVQLIKVPQYINATVASTLTCTPWNGTIGGVLSIEVSGTLSLSAPIDISGRGFRGGNVSANYYSGSLCSTTDYFFSTNPGAGGFKGEGITELPLNMQTGRGRQANGAGGGNHVNAGGGGGGNITNGGLGGNEWSGCSNLPIGGVGGQGLSTAINRIYLGGGGGGGQQNNSVSTPGVNGGGIIVIKANEIIANSNNILNNGRSQLLVARHDGAGGGGAGGTTLLDVNIFSGTFGISANGGKGGDTNNDFSSSACHAPGGGGSGGAIYSGITLPVNVSATVNPGVAGTTVNSGICFNTSYGALSGQPGSSFNNLMIVESGNPWLSMQLMATVTNANCLSNNGEAEIIVAGGVGPFTYTWNTSPIQTSSIATNLGVGNYTVIVTDSQGCMKDTTITINQTTLPSIVLSKADENCGGSD
ncbi:MAG: SprB repeat-containing protein, partial [Bacteroidota bacterium]|nr:SprB repeat-containing protein [Bacteroidota bacterium]